MGIFLSALLFIGPSYVANAAPLLLGGGAPLDGGRVFYDGQRIFGAHKTVRGLFAGIIAGSVIGIAESPIDSRLLLGGFMIALGTVIGGLVLGTLVFTLSWWSVLIVVLVTPPIHLGTNYGAYLLGIKRTRW